MHAGNLLQVSACEFWKLDYFSHCVAFGEKRLQQRILTTKIKCRIRKQYNWRRTWEEMTLQTFAKRRFVFPQFDQEQFRKAVKPQAGFRGKAGSEFASKLVLLHVITKTNPKSVPHTGSLFVFFILSLYLSFFLTVFRFIIFMTCWFITHIQKYRAGAIDCEWDSI